MNTPNSKVTKHKLDCDVCSNCKDHASFYCCTANEDGRPCTEDCRGNPESSCCGASPYDPSAYEDYGEDR